MKKIKVELLRISLGAFSFGGIKMFIHKCRKCVWGNKIAEQLICCMFPICIKTDAVKSSTKNKKVTVSKDKTSVNVNSKRRK